jgi:integrase
MGRSGRGVKPASKSSIEITFAYQGKRCRERIPLPPTAANLKRAEQHRANILYEISRGTFDYAQVFPKSIRASDHARLPGDVLLTGKYLEDWFERKKPKLAASTRREWNGIVMKMLIPKFKETALSALTRRDIKKWLEDLDLKRNKPLSNKRLANIQTVLRVALGDAVEDDLIEANVLGGYTYSRELPQYIGEYDADDVDPFSIEEQDAILKALSPQLSNLVKFAIWTGLRTSELVALNWSDIDWRKGFVRVRKAMTTAAKGGIETTKTRAGRRDVKLLAPALEALNDQKPFTYLLNGAVFHNPHTDARWTGDVPIWGMWQSGIRRAKVRYRKPYNTRHTYASMMLSAGEHPMWVAKQMGHADTAMIMRIYGHWMPDADASAGSKAVSIFAAAKKNDSTGTN